MFDPASKHEDLTGRSCFSRNLAFAWGGYAVNVVAGFVLPRLISDRLGQTTLGIWDLCWSIVGYFGLVQLGLAGSVDRYVAYYRALRDKEGLSRSVSTIGLFLKGASVLAAVVTVVTVWWVMPIYSTTFGQQFGDARWTVLFLGAEVAVMLSFAVYGGVIVGCHRWDTHNLISALTYAAIATGTVVAILCGGGLPALALVHLVVISAGEITRWRIARRVCPELQLQYRRACWATWAEQAKYSAKSLTPRVADLLSNQSLAILIGTFLGPAMLAIYSRPKNLIRHLHTLAAKCGYILVPTASSLQARSDQQDLRKTFKDATVLISFLTMPVVMVFAICGDDLIRLWMGAEYVHRGLVRVLAIGCFSSLVQEPVWAILAGINQHGKIAFARLSGAICAVVFVWIGLARLRWGLCEAAVAFALPQIAVEALITPLLACRVLSVPLREYYWATYVKPFICAAPFAGGLLAADLTFCNFPGFSVLLGVASMWFLLACYWRKVAPAPLRDRVSLTMRRAVSFGRLKGAAAKDKGVSMFGQPTSTSRGTCEAQQARRLAIPEGIERSTCAPFAAARIVIVFRNDDPSALSDLDHERELFAIFERHGVPQTIGVIPRVTLGHFHDCRKARERSLLKSSEQAMFLTEYVARSGSEVALHGYSHRTNRYSLASRREYFEFTGLPLLEQTEMICEGTEVLQRALGVRPVTFIPPWNRLDGNTVLACMRNGYKVISAGPYVETVDGILSFGANTDLVRFERAFSSALRADHRVFLNVNFHSRTIRTKEEKARLEWIIELVSRHPDCMVTTVAAVAAQFLEEVKVVNRAGYNVAPLCAVPGSVRSKTHPYHRAYRAVMKRSPLDGFRDAAWKYYVTGQYEACCSVTAPIDDLCKRVVRAARFLAFSVGCLSGGLAYWLYATEFLPLVPVHAVMPVCLLAVGSLLAHRATASSSRRELLVATVLATVGCLGTSIAILDS